MAICGADTACYGTAHGAMPILPAVNERSIDQ